MSHKSIKPRGYKSFFAALPEPALLLDGTGRILDANRTFCREFRTETKRIIGHDFWSVITISSQKKQSIIQHLQSIQQKTSAPAFKAGLIATAGGKTIPAMVKISYFQQNQKSYAVVIINTIASRTAVNQKISPIKPTFNLGDNNMAADLYTRLVTNSPVGIYIAQEGLFRYVNPQFQHITGYSETELTRMAPLSLVHPADRERVRENALRMVKGNAPVQNEFRIVTKSGEEKWAIENIVSINHQGKKASLANFLDITDRVKTENALRQALKVSEASMAEVSALLAASKTVLERPVFSDAAAAIFSIFKRLTGAAGGYVARVTVTESRYQIVHLDTNGVECHLPGASPMYIQGLSGESYRKGITVFDNDYPHSEWAKYLPAGHLQIDNILFTPIKLEKNQGGLIALVNKPGGFSVSDTELVSGVANFLTIALANSLAWDAMETSENRYRDLYNNAPIAFFSIGADGIIQTANNKAAELLDYTIQDLVGEAILELFANTNVGKERARAMFVRANTGKSIRDEELEMQTADGVNVWVSLSIEPVTDDDGRVTNHRLAAIDITERKQAEIALEESQARFMEMADLLPQGVWELNRQGKFTFMNKESLRSHGYTANEIFKLTAPDLFAPADKEKVKNNLEYVMNGGSAAGSQEYLAMRKDGGTFPVMIYAAPIVREGKNSGLRGITIDITERVSMENELGQKVAELQAANDRLKELDKLKDNFLSTVSHELRTPLTSIKSFAEILLAYEEDRATQKEFLGIINEEAGRLTRLINDFLDLSKIQAGRMQWTTVAVSIPWVIETAMNANRALINETKLDVALNIAPSLPPVWGDKDRLVQVMTNLLGNAIKFTPGGGNIKVNAVFQKQADRADDGQVLVSVTDSGIGIAPEHHQRIFEKFSQVGDTLKDRPRGTGLGLPISREIIEHYGGKIWVESALSKGSTFNFTLPVAVSARNESPENAVQLPALTKSTASKILIVDDEINVRKSIAHELTKRGYEVLEAASGKEAVDMARKHLPKLITLDVVMPDIDGFDVTSILKNDPLTKEIPILIVSVIEDKAKAFRLGVNDYITKPFDIDGLVDKIQAFFHGSPRSVLIVDDDRALVKSLEFELKKRKYDISLAYDGQEAVNRVKEKRPDLILLDINMPGMDGYEVLRVLKSDPVTAGIDILVMTGLEIDGARVRALSAGAREFFSKSGEISHLYDTIVRILNDKD